MVSRKILDERGVFTCDMDELGCRIDEAVCTLELIASTVSGGEIDEAAITAAVEGVKRMLLNLSYDLGNVDEVLRERGVIVTAEEAMARQRAADAATPAKVIALVAGKTARRSRKAVLHG